jgi:hypothetical protein
MIPSKLTIDSRTSSLCDVGATLVGREFVVPDDCPQPA